MNKKIKWIVGLLVAIVMAVMVVSHLQKDDPTGQVSGNGNHVVDDNPLDLEVVVDKPSDPVIIDDKKEEATYEEWLSAAMVIGISLQYPDYEYKEIYISDNKEAYVVFESKGTEIVLHSSSIESERSEPGTKDLYTKELGFVTFDEVSKNDISYDACEKIELSDLDALIKQSFLVSIYER